jgi:hypothetical protein
MEVASESVVVKHEIDPTTDLSVGYNEVQARRNLIN